MISALYTVAGAVLVLGVMILVHELGHFAAAKLLAQPAGRTPVGEEIASHGAENWAA